MNHPAVDRGPIGAEELEPERCLCGLRYLAECDCTEMSCTCIDGAECAVCAPTLTQASLSYFEVASNARLVEEMDRLSSKLAARLVGDPLDVIPSEHEAEAHARWLEWITPKLRYTCETVAGLYPSPEERARLVAQRDAMRARLRSRVSA